MAWNKPVIREIECRMEINMYGPEHDDESARSGLGRRRGG